MTKAELSLKRLMEATDQMQDHFRQDPAMDGNGCIWFNRGPKLKEHYREWLDAMDEAKEILEEEA